ncbi:hypothetical protein D3C72_361890 [compost metagenome]
MSLSPGERRVLLDRLKLEGELAPAAALAADAAEQYDRTMATLLASGDPAVVAEAIALADDQTPVRQSAPPHDTLEGGYGRHFGSVTVGDKARFLLTRVLGPERADEAIAHGPDWLQGRSLRWDARARRFL